MEATSSSPVRSTNEFPGRPVAGDFAIGLRASYDGVRGDFATGVRRATAPRVIGDFATGLRSRRDADITLGDFATGMRAADRRRRAAERGVARTPERPGLRRLRESPDTVT